ncbi:DUF3883 domain-containing protein [Cetobacterium somerae]|uniref:DUF3883 domain-containing protein n=1 Tax=Cetobacterium somerae TaxID=188913 RepID=UPI0038921656
MEFIEMIFYKKVNNGDLYNIDRTPKKSQGGGGQTYLDLGGIDEGKLCKFLEYGISERKKNPKEPRLKYTIDVIKLGSSISSKIEFDPRFKRKNYKLSDQRKNRHPAWLPENGFPKILDSTKSAIDITHIPNLFIFIIKTTLGKYYAGYVNNSIPASWNRFPGIDRLLLWEKKDTNKGFIDFENNSVFFKNDFTNPFFLVDKQEEFILPEVNEELTKQTDNQNFTLDNSKLKDLNFQIHDFPTNKTRKIIKKSISKKKITKFDHIEFAKINKIKGDYGEEIIFNLEKNKLITLGRKDLAERVEWVSKIKGDGFGYDIISWELIEGKEKQIFIEVKATVGGIRTPFDISANEIKTSLILGDQYRIYRVFEIGSSEKQINYYIIKGDIRSYFNLVPTSFKAILK